MEEENKNIENSEVNQEVVDVKLDQDGEPEFVQDPNDRKHIPWVPIIVMGSIVLLMIICVIVILVSGGPFDGPTSEIISK